MLTRGWPIKVHSDATGPAERFRGLAAEYIGAGSKSNSRTGETYRTFLVHFTESGEEVSIEEGWLIIQNVRASVYDAAGNLLEEDNISVPFEIGTPIGNSDHPKASKYGDRQWIVYQMGAVTFDQTQGRYVQQVRVRPPAPFSSTSDYR